MKHRHRAQPHHTHHRSTHHKHTHHNHTHRKTMQKHDKKFMIAAMVVVGAGLLLWLAWAPPRQPAEMTWEPFTPPKMYFVEGAPLPAAFPRELILAVSPEPVADAASSLAVAQFFERTEENAGKEIVTWNSPASMEQTFTSYQSYLPSIGWKIVRENADLADIRAIVAEKDAERVTISIRSVDAGSRVRVEYVARR